MKVSVNWIKEYLDFELPPVEELVTKIGAQLGAVEEVIDIGAKYKSVVVAKVVSCEKHPNADKLNVCVIDDGGSTPDVNRDENGHVQVVCGAPNVREGLLVAWIPPKAIVPSTYDTSDPFRLEARELRGVVSNGMLASGKELAINEDHDGILEIDQEAQPGQAFAEVYGLNDYIIDIENKMFTHRPDCFGQLGVAREIAGILGHKFTSPDWYSHVRQDIFKENTSLVSEGKLPVLVINEVPELVPRFSTLSIAGVTVKPSPIKIQSLLSRMGAKPINNVVDVTNYIMLLTGQPLHAYDYDKVQALDYERNPIQERLEPEAEARKKRVTLTIRYPKEGETIKLLNGKEITPRPEAIMIASKNHLIGIGGVMGGTETEVDENTKNIILECATFDMYSIRRTSMAHGLFTDAVTRFNKGQSPLQNDYIITQAAATTLEVAGGDLAGLGDSVGEGLSEYRKKASEPITVTSEFINARLGSGLNSEEIGNVLENVEFRKDVEAEVLNLYAPYWRTDIEISEDIVEEVGRLYGFDKLPLELPKRTITPTQRNTLLETKARIRNVLSRAGANEVLTYSFVHGDLLEKTGQNKDLAFQLSNALSPDLQYYRVSLTPSLLEKIHPNIKAGYTDGFGLFEIGKAHVTGEPDPYEPDVPKEVNALSFVYAAKKGEGAAYYTAQKYLNYLLDTLVKDSVFLVFEPLVSADLYNNPWLEQMVAPYDPERSIVLKDGKGMGWGVLGEFKASIRKKLKLPECAAGFELDPLLFTFSEKDSTYIPLPRFPKVMQDITLKVPTSVNHAKLLGFVTEYLHDNKPDHTRLNIITKDIYQKEDDKDNKQVTFGISIASYEKTMRDEEVTKLLDDLAEAVKKTLDADRI